MEGISRVIIQRQESQCHRGINRNSLVCVQGSQRGPVEDGSGMAGWDQIVESLEWGINF